MRQDWLIIPNPRPAVPQRLGKTFSTALYFRIRASKSKKFIDGTYSHSRHNLVTPWQRSFPAKHQPDQLLSTPFTRLQTGVGAPIHDPASAAQNAIIPRH